MKKHKNTIKWENLFLPVLKKVHKNHSKKIFHRMMKKSSTLKTGLKRRSKEYEVEFVASTYRRYYVSAKSDEEAKELAWKELESMRCGEGTDYISDAWLESAELSNIEESS